MLLQSYYNVYGVQQFSPYYPSGGAGASGAVGLIHNNIYPFYGQYSQNIQAHHGFGVQQYPQMAQFPFLPQHYGSTGILSYPSSVAVPTTSAGDKLTLMHKDISFYFIFLFLFILIVSSH